MDVDELIEFMSQKEADASEAGAKYSADVFSRTAQALRELQSLREGIEQAHMAGQHNAGVDPSYSEAQAYRLKVTEIHNA